MKGMTEEELLKYLEPLNMIYYLSSIGPIIKPKSRDKHDCTCSIKLSDLEITIKKPQPEITIKNLGLFMAKHGKYPEAEFENPNLCQIKMRRLISLDLTNPDYRYLCSKGCTWQNCTITDPLWASLEASE